MAVKMHLSFFIFATIGSMQLVSVSSTTHIVGDNLGWNVPNSPTFYKEWAQNRTFVVGDVLLFQYNPGLNTVILVEKSDYDSCTTKKILHTYFRGNSSVTLDRVGDYYFFSSVGMHCEFGQKLHVDVVAPSTISSH
ncbi:stellacyanin [Cajanus cajan]|uniref:Early nodulin-like protein 1 n=1 Tax=Cajanus cajan TaxID=3821 RepID=A0A151SV54_CAJCA|nr:stellacyanin [Cajanus cajan]KYP58677.1 Early nodulin-like protein 1 [Cajanus cajan]